MKFIKLTAPDGQPVWIGAQWVMSVRVPAAGMFGPEARTLIAMGEAKQAVKETPQEVLKLLAETEEKEGP